MSIRTQYDSDLEALKAALAEMGRSSADAVEDALEALCTADAEDVYKRQVQWCRWPRKRCELPADL